MSQCFRPCQVDLTVTPGDQTALRKNQLPPRRKRKGKTPKASPAKKPASKGTRTKDKGGDPKPVVSEGDAKGNDAPKKRGRRPKTSAPANAETVEDGGKRVGCSRCRYKSGCVTCRNPDFKPRGPRQPKPNQSKKSQTRDWSKKPSNKAKPVDVD